MKSDAVMMLYLCDSLMSNWDKRTGVFRGLMGKAVYQMCPGQTRSILQNIRRSNDPLKLLVTSSTQEGTGKRQHIFLHPGLPQSFVFFFIGSSHAEPQYQESGLEIDSIIRLWLCLVLKFPPILII